MKKIKIKCGEWEAVLYPEYGMNTASLRCGDTSILREAKDDSAFAENLLLYGIPVIFPANRTKDARFSFEGREYTLPLNEPERGNNLHGSLYCSEFEVLEVRESEVISRIVNRGGDYPFPFTLTFTDTVTEAGYRRRAVITNDGEGNMPYTFALHSTFAEPKLFTVPIGERYEWDECYIPTGRELPLDDFERTFHQGCVPDGREISAPYKAVGCEAVLDSFKLRVSDNFDRWVFYNGNGHEGYLCVEPQCGDVNGLNTADGHRVLCPGESAVFTFEITSAPGTL